MTVHTMDHCPALRKYVLTSATTQINLENVMLNGTGQAKKRQTLHNLLMKIFKEAKPGDRERSMVGVRGWV